MYCNHKDYTEGCEWCEKRRELANPVQDIIDVIEPIYKEEGLSGVARYIHNLDKDNEVYWKCRCCGKVWPIYHKLCDCKIIW